MLLWGSRKLGCSSLSHEMCCVDSAALREPAYVLLCAFCLGGIVWIVLRAVR